MPDPYYGQMDSLLFHAMQQNKLYMAFGDDVIMMKDVCYKTELYTSVWNPNNIFYLSSRGA